MANERITQRILEEAQQKAAEITAQAESAAKRATEEARAKTQADCEAILLRANNDAEEKQRRAVVVAELDSRKKELAVKREVLDIAYEKAAQAFVAMDDAAYQAAYIKVTLPSISKGTESVAPGKQDEQRLGAAFVDRLNAEAAKKGLPGELKLGPARTDMDRGVVISDRGMEINLSTASVMRSVREETEGEVAKILFAAQEG